MKNVQGPIHPGTSNTKLGRAWYFAVLRIVVFFFAQSAAMGALPTIRAAADVKGTESGKPPTMKKTRKNCGNYLRSQLG